MVRKICAPDTLESDLHAVSDCLSRNGYPEKFIVRHMKERKRQEIQTVKKKELFLRLRFKEDCASDIVTKRLSKALGQTFPAAQLRIVYYSRPLLSSPLKDQVSQLAKSMLIYQFTCSCGACYVGRTMRHLIERAKEHHPRWLSSGVKKTSHSSILSHLIDNDHRIKIEEAFRIVYTIPICYPKGIRTRLLNTAEAVAIRLIKPILCVHKQFVQILSLPWPDGTHPSSNSHVINVDINAHTTDTQTNQPTVNPIHG